GVRASTQEYRGIPVMVVLPFGREQEYFTDTRWLAILESKIAVFGTENSVRLELDRYLGQSEAEAALVEKLKHLNKSDNTWSVVGAPMPGRHLRGIFGLLDPGLGAALESGGVFEFGIAFGNRDVTLHYELAPAAVPASAEVAA